MMSDEKPPAITWEALTQEEHDEEEDEKEHPPYDKRMIGRAITGGLNPAGKNLDLTMPRWRMNRKELNAIIDFLKKLD